ncbi:hypothetical protein F5888DRAFT_1635594 [Russula emetica]|nr:hypothetical protein F5888DRAFT_1635594 [Russula emetica]
MNTSLLPKSKSSYDRNFDDMADRRHLLFRLQSHNHSHTFFHPKEKVLVASLHCQKLSEDSSSEELSLRLTALKEASPSLTLTSKEESEAVEKHLTSWHNHDKEPSNYISLTFDVLYVLWMWKRRFSSLLQSEGRQLEDDFRIIVLNSSKLRASGRAKLGTQLLSREIEKYKDAYTFARAHEEVIVAKYIQSEAILGSMPLSRLEVFIPSRCRKLLETTKGTGSKTLTKSLPPAVDKVDCTMVRESLRFSLALLAPMLVPDEQQRANIGSGKEAGCGAIKHSRTDGMSPSVEPICVHEAEDGGSRIPASYGKRGRSPEMGSLLAGTTGGSLKQEPPAKRRRLSEEEQPLHGLKNENVRSPDTERDGQDSMESLKWECERVVALATEMCRVREKGHEECQRMLTVHGLELLNRYRDRTAMQRDLGKEPLETLRKIMDEYEGWDKGTS